jgi:hypothetical protein
MVLAISTSSRAAASGSRSRRFSAFLHAYMRAARGRLQAMLRDLDDHEYARFLPIQRLALFECEDGRSPGHIPTMPRMMPPKKTMPINQSAYIIQNPMAVSADNMKLIMARSAAMRLGHGPTSIARAFRHRIIT